MSISNDAVALSTVTVSRTSERVARLTLNRPERRNAVSPQVADDIAEAVSTIRDWGTPLAVLDANGPAFSAGVDLADLTAGGAALDQVLEILGSAPIHWTAKVSGAVRGGGLSMLAVCPAVVATTGSTFGLPEITRGFFPTSVVPAQLARVGARRAFAMAFTGAVVDAETACTWGLVSAVVEPEHIDEYVNAEVTGLATLEPDAIREGVRAWQAQLSAESTR